MQNILHELTAGIFFKKIYCAIVATMYCWQIIIVYVKCEKTE